MQLLTTSEAADYLRLHRTTLAKWRVGGRGPRYRKHGQRVYYRVGDLDAWSDAQVRSSTSDAGPGALPGQNRSAPREVVATKTARPQGRRRATGRLQVDA